MVADGTDPPVVTDGGGGECVPKSVAAMDFSRSDPDRRGGGCGGVHVDVVVVQSRDDGAPRGVEYRLSPSRGEVRCDLDDAMVGPDVGVRAVQQPRSLDQHGASLRSATRRSTRSPSAPRPWAVSGTLGGRGTAAAQSPSPSSSGDSGTAA